MPGGGGHSSKKLHLKDRFTLCGGTISLDVSPIHFLSSL